MCPSAPLAAATRSANTSPLEVRVEWEWMPAEEASPSGSHTLTGSVVDPPLVAPLYDTNGDGRVDGGDVPSVLVPVLLAEGEDFYDHIMALAGDTGQPLWVSERMAFGNWVPAVGDLDGDGHVEIVAPNLLGWPSVWDHNGHLAVDGKHKSYFVSCLAMRDVWETFWWEAFSISDMDHDGLAEVIVGRTVLRADMSSYLLFEDELHRLYDGPCGNGTSLAVDLVGDDEEELLLGSTAYGLDGTERFSVPNLPPKAKPSGYPAVADFDGDGVPEVISAGRMCGIGIYDLQGNQLDTEPETCHGSPSPQAVADLDGDGVPELISAFAEGLTAQDVHGWLRWGFLAPRPEVRGAAEGVATVFDFDGDGFPEVLFLSGRTLYVLSGIDGAVRLAYEGAGGGLDPDLPVVADVDGDGEAEIVVPARVDPEKPYPRGVRVLGSAGKPWPPARRIWNQVNYFRDNVNDDGSIPRVAGKPWLTHNTFRSADLVTGKELWSSVDLVMRAGDACLARCEGGRLKVQATVGNQGYVASTQGAKVALYATVTLPSEEDDRDAGGSPDGRAAAPASATRDVELATWTVDETIEPGQRTPVHTFQVPLQALSEALDGGDLLALHATVTASAQDAEYHTENNDTAWGLAPCELP